MYHFFVERSQIHLESVTITGPDVNHIKNVLRMKPGEQVLISNGEDRDYLCRLTEISADAVEAEILEEREETTELPAKIWLFQGLPKSDKMELIIQKAVELGAYQIVPVATKRAVVKLDKKKEEAKLKRWNAISESAAKQSKRLIIPEIAPVMSFDEALAFVKDFDSRCIPYECASGMDSVRQFVEQTGPGQKIAVFIGPEGGFEETEIEKAREAGVVPVSLGKRILRTETAGLALLSVLAFHLEGGL